MQNKIEANITSVNEANASETYLTWQQDWKKQVVS